jgi:hypothetical protein
MLARGKAMSWPDWVKPGALFRPKAWTEREQFLGMILEVQDWDNYHGTMPCILHFWMIESGRGGDPTYTWWKPIIYFTGNDTDYSAMYIHVP